jgi:hypothetical protein
LFNSFGTKAFFASIVATVSDPNGIRNGGFRSSYDLQEGLGHACRAAGLA